MKKRISAVIFAHNDQDKISDCISSILPLTKNIFLLDIGSTDKTPNIAEQLGVKVYKSKFVKYVELVREDGIKLADTEWVLLLDADEKVSADLGKEINEVVLGGKRGRTPTSAQIMASMSSTGGKDTLDRTRQINAFKIPRKNIFAGKRWLRFGGWWPDYQIRLINKNFFVRWPKQIHSAPEVMGECGYLTNPIIHFFHGDFENMVNKTLIFEDIESELLYKAGRTANQMIFVRKFLGEFYRRLFKNLGFLDGPIGIIESIYQSFSKTITYLFLYEKKKNRTVRPIS